MSNPIRAIPSAQNADHLMLLGKYLSKRENGSCELTDHSSTFRSSIHWNLRFRNFFGHSNTSISTSRRKYKLAIHDFTFNLTSYCLLSEAYAANLIPTGIDNFLRALIYNSEKHKHIEQSALGNLSHKSQQNLELRQLSCVQAACLVFRSVNARNGLSTIGWQQFLDLKSSDLINPNAQAFNLGELSDIAYC